MKAESGEVALGVEQHELAAAREAAAGDDRGPEGQEGHQAAPAQRAQVVGQRQDRLRLERERAIGLIDGSVAVRAATPAPAGVPSRPPSAARARASRRRRRGSAAHARRLAQRRERREQVVARGGHVQPHLARLGGGDQGGARGRTDGGDRRDVDAPLLQQLEASDVDDLHAARGIAHRAQPRRAVDVGARAAELLVRRREGDASGGLVWLVDARERAGAAVRRRPWRGPTAARRTRRPARCPTRASRRLRASRSAARPSRRAAAARRPRGGCECCRRTARARCEPVSVPMTPCSRRRPRATSRGRRRRAGSRPWAAARPQDRRAPARRRGCRGRCVGRRMGDAPPDELPATTTKSATSSAGRRASRARSASRAARQSR